MSAGSNLILYDRGFLKEVRKLPIETQEKLSELIQLLKQDVSDSRLHAKPLGPPLQGIFSFRITRDYRVAFKFEAPHAIRLLVADNRNQFYQRLKRKR